MARERIRGRSHDTAADREESSAALGGRCSFTRDARWDADSASNATPQQVGEAEVAREFSGDDPNSASTNAQALSERSEGTLQTQSVSQRFQSSEQFAASQEVSGDNAARATGGRPPIIVDVPPEEQSCASSVTFCFRGADLFVPSLYPSTMALTADPMDNAVLPKDILEIRKLPALEEEENPKDVTGDQDLFKREKEKIFGAKPPPIIVNTIKGAQEGLTGKSIMDHPFTIKGTPDVSAEYTEMDLTLTTMTEEKPKMATPLVNGTNQQFQSPIPDPFTHLTQIMPLPEHTPVDTKSLPGAYHVSNPTERPPSRHWHPHGDEYDQQSNPSPPENSNYAIDSTLVHAQPVSSSLPVAMPEEENRLRAQAGKPQGSESIDSVHWRLLVALGGVILLSAVLYLSIFPANLDPMKLRQMHIKSIIEEEFGMEYFDNQQKEKALHWIVFQDPQQGLAVASGNEDDASRLIQRFALAAFYYQSSTQQPWTYCNPPEGQQSEVCYAVLGINYQGTRNGQRAVRWLSAANECQWMGIYCTHGRVSEIVLASNNMTGWIPSELSKLSQLKRINLASNSLSGPLPRWMDLNPLPLLESLQLDHNLLSGTIPPEYFSMQKLGLVWLEDNQFTGSLPSQIGSFTGCFVSLRHNLITGSIPSEVYTLSALEQFFASGNLLEGTLSSRVGKLQSLEIFMIADCNSIGGLLPTEIGQLPNLKALSVSNTRINGTIPDELFNAAAFSMLDLSGTQISGTISGRIGLLTNLDTLRIAKTQIGGFIPSKIFALNNLQTLEIQENTNLKGSIPEKFCRKRVINNAMRHSTIAADCTPSNSTGKPAVVCPRGCCTICCDAETHICSGV